MKLYIIIHEKNGPTIVNDAELKFVLPLLKMTESKYILAPFEIKDEEMPILQKFFPELGSSDPLASQSESIPVDFQKEMPCDCPACKLSAIIQTLIKAPKVPKRDSGEQHFSN